ncbi:MAG: hypothetical protein HDR06_05355 [Lachnospiraceae bacterium]|nr:hypothetical protein [Lachnospiraceae bacterium]
MQRQWGSLREFFDELNLQCYYVVLRNFDYLPEKYKCELHGDIDILTDDVNKMVDVTGAKKTALKRYRTHYICRIGDKDVEFDFRYIGDGYYCKKWEKDILKNRIMNDSGIYIPNDEDYKYTILYHALVHKKEIAADYCKIITAIFGENPMELIEHLKKYIKDNNYKFSQPYDLSVVFNFRNIPVILTPRRFIYRFYLDISMRSRYKWSVIRKKIRAEE